MHQEYCNICEVKVTCSGVMVSSQHGKIPAEVWDHCQEQVHLEKLDILTAQIHQAKLKTQNMEFCENDYSKIKLANSPSLVEHWKAGLTW